MSQDHLDNEAPWPPRWRGHLTLPMLLLLGWLLYELTAQPALGVAAVCLKFGWEDFRTACWLRRRDPVRGRARACFWLYTASGLWKSAITASVMIFAFAFLKGMQANAGGGQARLGGELPPQVIGALLTAFGSYVLSSLATCAAVWLALWYRIKLWLDAGVHRARREGLWPPPDYRDLRTNKAGRVVLTALVLTLFTCGFTTLVAVALGLGGRRPDAFGLLAIMGTLLLLMFVGPVLILAGRDLLVRHVFAATPSECWGAVPVEDGPWAALDQPDLDRAPGY
jgi:hypothetical protein